MTHAPMTGVETGLASHALGYARAGQAVFPCRPNSKIPATPRGHLDATTDLAQIAAWWADNPAYNIGLPLAANGLIAVDADTYKDGCGWREFAAGHEVPETLRARSASGGMHLIYTAPGEHRFPAQLVAGVDLKHQGYILVAPSVFDGKSYVWETDDKPAPAPDWLLSLRSAPVGEGARTGVSKDKSALMATLLRGESIHDTTRDLAAAMAAQGTPARAIVDTLSGLLDQAHNLAPGRETARRKGLKSLADSAVAKYGPASQNDRGFGDAPHAAAHRPRYTATDFADIQTATTPYWIKGLIPQGGITAVYGTPKSGKSFLCLDLAQTLAFGENWRGLRTKTAKVLYWVGEGHSGFRNRVVALRNARDGASPDWFKVLSGPVSLTDPYEAEDFITEIERHAPDVLFIDTLARAFGAGDENSTKDMSYAVNMAGELVARTGAALILVHHAGKSQDAGLRGSTALLGGVDQVLKVTKDEAGDRSMLVEASREGEEGARFNFGLRPQYLGKDGDGEDMVSCVVEHYDDGWQLDLRARTCERTPVRAASVSEGPTLSANLSALFDTVSDFLRLKGRDVPFDIGGIYGLQGAPSADLAAHLADCGFLKDGTAKQLRDRTKSRLKPLTDRRLLKLEGGWIWPTGRRPARGTV